MKNRLILVITLSLYSDLIKRLFNPKLSLAIIYILALLLLISISAFKKNKNDSTNDYKRNSLNLLIIKSLLIFYTFHALASLLITQNYEFTILNYLYVGLPIGMMLAFYYKNPDLDEFKYFLYLFLLLMIPINIVGIIQFYFLPNFLISYNYSSSGGIIMRNFEEGIKVFTRHPSIFASADRFANMAQLQFVFTLLYLTLMENKKNITVIILGFLFSLSSIVISGARSKILFVIIISILFLIYSQKDLFHRINKYGLIFAIFLLFSMLFILFQNYLLEVSSINFFIRTWMSGNIFMRISEALWMSLPFQGISIFGYGLGTLLQGRPGEFGIYTLWYEGGIVFGTLILSTYLVFDILLIKKTIVSIKYKSDFIFILSISLFILTTIAIFTGLSNIYEFSTGLILSFCYAFLLKIDQYCIGSA